MENKMKTMKGFSLATVGPPILIIIGITLVFIIGRNASTEEYIHSYRAREAFSTLNHLEFAKKTFAGWMDFAVPAATLELGRAGLGADDAHSKDGIALWTPGAPTDDEAKTKLKEGIKSKVSSLETIQIEGKYALIDYTQDLGGKKDTEIELGIPAPLSSAEYFDVTGKRPFRVVKDIKKQAIYYAADSVGVINQHISSRFFKMFAFARDFLVNGGLSNLIRDALSMSTTASLTRSGCSNAPDRCDGGCPTLDVSQPTPQDVFSASGLASQFTAKINSVTKVIGGAFNSKITLDSFSAKYGYLGGDVSTPTGACAFSCLYATTCTGTREVCDTSEPPVCHDEEYTYDCDQTRVCDTGITRTTNVDFTLLADVYLKYSSQDAQSLVPSDTPNPATGLPFNSLEFNYMVHACSTVKSGSVSTAFKEDVLNCRLEGYTPVS